MNELITAAAAMPAALFTIMVLVMVLYWVMVALGTVDIDLFHLDVDADGGHDVDAHAHTGGHGFLEFLSIGKVPITVLATLFVLGGWLLCLSGEILVRPHLPEMMAGWLLSLVLGGGATVLALFGAALAARPLRPLFTIAAATRREHMIGRPAIVTSQTVDATFGTASCVIDGDDIILNVVIRDSRRLVKGDAIVIVDYDEQQGVHLVAPFQQPALPESTDLSANPPSLSTSVQLPGSES